MHFLSPRLWKIALIDADIFFLTVFSMPLQVRSLAHDGEALADALSSGVLTLVGSDHAVFNKEQKRKGKGDFRIIPNGINGIEGEPLAF